MKLNRLLVVGAISLVALAGCSAPQTTTPAAETSEQQAPTAKVTEEKADNSKTPGNFGSLYGVISQTKAAVNSGDFAKAKTEFNKFETSWAKVEDGVKAKSSQSYDAIEESTDAVKKSLKASNPDKMKATAALESLDNKLKTAAK